MVSTAQYAGVAGSLQSTGKYQNSSGRMDYQIFDPVGMGGSMSTENLS